MRCTSNSARKSRRENGDGAPKAILTWGGSANWRKSDPDLDGQRRHFFPACLGESLPFCSFFRRLGYLVAGFLTIRRSFFAMPAPRSGEAAACRPVRPTPISRPSLVEFAETVTAPPYPPITLP